MSIINRENQSLKAYNTFGFDVNASHFSIINHIDDVAQLVNHPWWSMPKIIIGGGSNMLFTKDVTAWVIKNNIKGIEVIAEDHQSVTVAVAGGEVWHDFVMYAVGKSWGGVENLALIPGTVGAAPMQNIGAYGVEVKDVIYSVTYFDLEQQVFVTLSNEACEFGYRDSIFKRLYKNKIIITSVTFVLKKNHKVNTSYGAIQDVLDQRGVAAPLIKDIAAAVVYIRQSKLPDPKVIGNAGSFFKNPVVPNAILNNIKATYPDVPSYKVDDGHVKIPAGWLIEQRGWKGKKVGAVGVHDRQALVLVNVAQGKGQEIWDLSTAIIEDINTHFGITLEREVQVY